MKKLAITAAAVLAAVFLGTGTAHALVPGVDIMDTEVGYGYNAAKDGIHSAHIEIKPIPKVVARNTGTGTMQAMKRMCMRSTKSATSISAQATETIMTEMQNFSDLLKDAQTS